VNPECSNEFLYLRDGELFVVRSQKSVQYFWLCPSCAVSYRLVHDATSGARVIAKVVDEPSKTSCGAAEKSVPTYSDGSSSTSRINY
jgi:hypothetical protein